MRDHDECLLGYLESAVWASSGWDSMADGEDNPLPLDDIGYTPDDFTPEARAFASRECLDFETEMADTLSAWYAAGMTPERGGHDFFLTRNHHGAGFWDRFWNCPEEKLGEQLTDAAHAHGEADVMETGSGSLEFYGQES